MIELPTEADPVRIVEGDCLAVLPTLAAGSVDAVVTDPPYGLSFMGKGWDQQVPGPDYWRAVLRVLKPGGHMLAMGGTRTYHRLACAVEDAGFELRDCLMWLYGTGFPKGKGSLKPAWEPIILARKPGPKVLPLGIDGCRIATDGTERLSGGSVSTRSDGWDRPWKADPAAVSACKERSAAAVVKAELLGRYPANVVHDGSDEVIAAFAVFGERKVNRPSRRVTEYGNGNTVYAPNQGERRIQDYADIGTAARFFYAAKAGKAERGEGNAHPTVKPLKLCKWLVRLVCPEGGLVLDPFAGSGTTAVACLAEGRRCVLIEREPAYAEIARNRVAAALTDTSLFAGQP